MKKTTMYIVMALLCLNFCANAQEIKPLKIGDKLPAAFWQQEHEFLRNGNPTKQNLSSYQGKLLILDFFATWCTTCVGKLKDMEQLPQQPGDNYSFLPVSAKNTGDRPEKIEALQKRLKMNVLETVLIGDSTLNKLFPHRTVPCYVWIDENGIVQGITGSSLFSSSAIDQLLSKKKISKQIGANPKPSKK